MDCSAEEELVRLKLARFKSIRRVLIDLTNRTVEVHHDGQLMAITEALESLRLDSKLLSNVATEETALPASEHIERKLLLVVLLINAFFFLTEMTTGFIAHSMGLVADSLDMLADAVVYGLSLYAIGGALSTKRRIAHASGWFQMALAMLGLVEVTRRFFGFGEVPTFEMMIIVSLFALAGNAASFYVLQRSKSKEAHIQASMIFTSNDVIANVGVIIAGVLVYVTGSKLPDLTVGTLVFLLVVRGAVRILKL